MPGISPDHPTTQRKTVPDDNPPPHKKRGKGGRGRASKGPPKPPTKRVPVTFAEQMDVGDEVNLVIPFAGPTTVMPNASPKFDGAAYAFADSSIGDLYEKDAKELKELLTIKYGDPDLEGKIFPWLFPHGVGSWRWQKTSSLKMIPYCKRRLLGYHSAFRNDPDWSFWWLDRWTKNNIFWYNRSTCAKRGEGVAAGTLQNDVATDSYLKYGTTLPRTSPAFCGFWQHKL